MPIYRIVCTYTPTYKCMCVYIYTHTHKHKYNRGSFYDGVTFSNIWLQIESS